MPFKKTLHMHPEIQTHKMQSRLASFCRSGENPGLKGLREGRLKYYRRLVFNNVNGSLKSAYPLTHNFLSEEKWLSVVRDFFREHSCESPQIWQMPGEFLNWLTETDDPLLKEYEFLPELLLMEWLEVELFMMEDIECEYSTEQNAQRDKLLINPEHRLLAFNYPVHLKNAAEITEADKGNYYLLMHRHPSNGSIVFTDVSVFFAAMMQYLSKENSNKKNLINKSCAVFKLELNDEILMRSNEFIGKALSTQLILGFTN